MGYLGHEFTADDAVKSASNFEPLPDGWYSAVVASAELTTTKAGNGKYIKIKFELDNGRIVFTNLNIFNDNVAAEAVGRKQLNELMIASGLSSVKDTDELIGARCQIKLTTKKSEQYGDSNEVKGYKKSETTINKPVASATQQTQKAAPPWAKKPQQPAPTAPAAPVIDDNLPF